MKPVGYLVNSERGPEGEAGLFYDYILAQNGLFIRARSPLIEATIPVTEPEIRGLAPLEYNVRLINGKIPLVLSELAISILLTDCFRERFLAITWEGGEYRLRSPAQDGEAAGVIYERIPGTVVDIHSHGDMKPFFSTTDNADEQGLRFYMVVGNLPTAKPDILVRIGVYGYFFTVDMREVFEHDVYTL